METNGNEKTALLIIDMVKDNFVPEKHLPITEHALRIINPINKLALRVRDAGGWVVFSTDAFREDDFIFHGRMRPHALAGTTGAEIIDELDRRPEDLWLPKPKFSAFFDTDLADQLSDRKITRCAVAGIATNFCVLTTVMDAICNDFQAVMLEDCTAAFTPQIHENTLSLYRRNPLHPLLRVDSSNVLTGEL
ncbi:MAG: cysteine hydrolase [Desulfobacteraceae bacterium]|nr:cysteine hydrolase [Desulfobacteraceae bacterium]